MASWERARRFIDRWLARSYEESAHVTRRDSLMSILDNGYGWGWVGGSFYGKVIRPFVIVDAIHGDGTLERVYVFGERPPSTRRLLEKFLAITDDVVAGRYQPLRSYRALQALHWARCAVSAVTHNEDFLASFEAYETVVNETVDDAISYALGEDNPLLFGGDEIEEIRDFCRPGSGR